MKTMNTDSEVAVEAGALGCGARLVWRAFSEGLRATGLVGIVEWAERHVVIPKGPEPGRFRCARTPYLREPLESCVTPGIRQVTLKWSTQVGKSTIGHLLLGYWIDQKPGDCLVVLPTEETAKEVSSERIEPMLFDMPAIRRRAVRTGKKSKQTRYTFDRMMVFFGWANSPSSLASRPCKYGLYDEVGKFPKFAGGEASPIKLAHERTKNFWNSFELVTSTPTKTTHVKGSDGGSVDEITKQYLDGDRRKCHVPCPHCGVYQVLVWSQVKWAHGESPRAIQKKGLAWYECEGCGGKIEDRHKKGMLERCVWVPEGGELSADDADERRFEDESVAKPNSGAKEEGDLSADDADDRRLEDESIAKPKRNTDGELKTKSFVKPKRNTDGELKTKSFVKPKRNTGGEAGTKSFVKPKKNTDKEGAGLPVVVGAPETDHRSYHLWAAYSPWVTFGQIVSEWLKSYRNVEDLMNFVNGWLGEAFEERSVDVTMDGLERLKVNYKLGRCPSAVQVITAGVDVQKDHCWYVVRGWGMHQESWLIDYGIVRSTTDSTDSTDALRGKRMGSTTDSTDSTDGNTLRGQRGGETQSERDLEALRVQLEGARYLRGDGETLPVSMICWDSAYRTDKVYAVTRRSLATMKPVKGANRSIPQGYQCTSIERTWKGKALGVFMLYHLDTELYKDRVHAARTAQPSLWHLPEDVDATYLQQVTSEHKVVVRDTKGRPHEVWALKAENAGNHLWDCEVYARAALEIGGWVQRLVSGGGAVRGPLRTAGFKMPGGRKFLVRR